ncbi:hypothetical protein C0Z01_14725 [Photobacterium kishitanii]|uniref:hypothetical protein n=1 Tax=Photobacterium kishitanii TaxID=318456 RepID=UPI000434CC77|nr:hypothetical protein [Photobacterium kishitanii]OBU25809.1 hypothetical protein AYY22_19875 [Photobacterium kishitanii]PSU91519.1 hypothetical protein C0W35_15530 [Photobacterium kishitanii]PSW68564.1 hypothetical protein C0Z01_14725 [Photobacterium kishitanii]CEO41603.1 putative Membrane protein [Photobacterium kishitanii]
MRSDTNIIFLKIINFIFLLVILTTPFIIINYDVIYLKNNIPEQSLTEYTQELLLFGCSISFAYLGMTQALYRRCAFLIAGFFSCMLIRELDLFFDQLVFHGFWVYPASIIAFITVIYASQEREQTLSALAEFMKNNYFPILCLGLGITLVYSRLFGMGSMWHQVLGHDYHRIVKNIAEESSELLGYVLMFYASINYVYSYFKHQTSSN